MNANDTMGQHGLWRSMAQLDSTGGGDSTKSGQRSGMRYRQDILLGQAGLIVRWLTNANTWAQSCAMLHLWL